MECSLEDFRERIQADGPKFQTDRGGHPVSFSVSVNLLQRLRRLSHNAATMQSLFCAAGFVKVHQADPLTSISSIARIGEVENAYQILDGEGVAVEGIKG